MAIHIIEGDEARNLSREEKWNLLSPYLKQHGRGCMAYSTLQEGLEYLLDDDRGYVAYASVRHPILAPRGRRLVLGDPICSDEDRGRLMDSFLEMKGAVFFQIYRDFSLELKERGYSVNHMGIETELPVQSYEVKGNKMDLLKRAKNEILREGVSIREVSENELEFLSMEMEKISGDWMSNKSVDKEIWYFARPAIFSPENDVRKFVAFNREGNLIGFNFYDPIYNEGKKVGYVDNVSREFLDSGLKRLPIAINLMAIESFKEEGIEILNLALSPFYNLEETKGQDIFIKKTFSNLYKNGEKIYPFQGLSFHKSRYRGKEVPVFFASDRKIPLADVYLGFRNSKIIPNLVSFVRKIRGKGLIGFFKN
jgi:lysylphosphatidylglycerol synthetase-like protein (DUF2156 family)